MENASQALLIAGGILLAILTISLFVYMFNNLSIIGNAEQDKEEAKRLADWNAEWEAYNKQYLHGAEVLTVVNKAKQNNSDYAGNSAYQVNVSIEHGGIIATNIGMYLENRKLSIYSCKEMTDTNGDGRIDNIVFEYKE